jgi:hypothetical protein
MRRHIRRPSAATMLAGAALFVALGGTSVAAVAVVLPANSVGTAQIKTNAVTSAKIANGTLLKVDFKAGQLVAGPAGAAGAAGPAGPPGPAGAAGAGATLAYKLVSSTDVTTTNATSFVDVPNATASVDVPAGQSATLVITLTGESACYGPDLGPSPPAPAPVPGSCLVQVLVDGIQAQPQAGSNYAFDSNNLDTTNQSVRHSQTVTRYLTGAAAGSHTVKIQWQVTSAALTFRLANWTLQTQVIKTS